MEDSIEGDGSGDGEAAGLQEGYMVAEAKEEVDGLMLTDPEADGLDSAEGDIVIKTLGEAEAEVEVTLLQERNEDMETCAEAERDAEDEAARLQEEAALDDAEADGDGLVSADVETSAEADGDVLASADVETSAEADGTTEKDTEPDMLTLVEAVNDPLALTGGDKLATLDQEGCWDSERGALALWLGDADTDGISDGVAAADSDASALGDPIGVTEGGVEAEPVIVTVAQGVTVSVEDSRGLDEGTALPEEVLEAVVVVDPIADVEAVLVGTELIEAAPELDTVFETEEEAETVAVVVVAAEGVADTELVADTEPVTLAEPDEEADTEADVVASPVPAGEALRVTLGLSDSEVVAEGEVETDTLVDSLADANGDLL